MDSLTSASVVPERLRQTGPANGFTDSGFETEIRDLYGIGFNPILTRRTFYQAADGFGETPDDAAAEQRFVTAADYVIFASHDWYGSPNAMTKGFMELVFA